MNVRSTFPRPKILRSASPHSTSARQTTPRSTILKRGIAAGALLSVAVLTVGCATPTAGTASVGVVAATAAVTSSSPAASSTSSSPSPATTASSSSSSSSSSSDDSATALPTLTDDSSVPDPGTDSPADPVEVDATTALWLENSCTDLGTLFAALFALPTIDETAPVEDFRAAYRDYYASLADTLLGMTERLAQLDPPQIEGGQALHDGYLQYLIQLADISGSGAIAIDEAPADPQAIADIVEHIQFDTERLGEGDFGLSDFQGEELQALMAQIPACAELMNS
ncbi:hypothetical protein ACVBEQ_16335 [Nakamurella sp. GG22]